MTGVPGIGPIGVVTGSGGLAMAGATELVHLGRRHVFGISHCRLAGNVVPAWTVANLALHAGLGGLNSGARGKLQGASGMALETAEDCSVWIEGTIFFTFRGAVARSQRHGTGGRVPTRAMLEVGILINSADERDCLQPGAERPFPRLRRY
jgi:hypothetical protein